MREGCSFGAEAVSEGAGFSVGGDYVLERFIIGFIYWGGGGRRR